MKKLLIILIISLILINGCGTPTVDNKDLSEPKVVSKIEESKPSQFLEIIQVVSKELKTNELQITKDDLLAMNNPKGEGVFVYVEKTLFFGIKRNIFWLVLDGEAYILNGATKNVTPSIKWARDVLQSKWKTTGLSPYTATTSIKIIFGD